MALNFNRFKWMCGLPRIHFAGKSQSRPPFGIPKDAFVSPRHALEARTACVDPPYGLQAFSFSGVEVSDHAQVFLKQDPQVFVGGVSEGNIEGAHHDGILGGRAPKGTQSRFVIDKQSLSPHVLREHSTRFT